MIVIINYDVGNLGSILNMLKKIGAEAIISSNQEDIKKADKLILPGVGSFNYGMEKLQQSGLIELLNRKVLNEKTPILGICLGLQLFTKKSEEGKLNGMGWIDAQTVKFQFNSEQKQLKIPHMGWNEVAVKKQSVLFKDMSFEESRFYFVHSYYVQCNQEQDILTTTHYGYDFHSGVEKENIVGVQFHPEKSHKFGLKLLKNFVELF